VTIGRPSRDLLINNSGNTNAEVRRLDRRITATDTNIAAAVEHTGSTLTQLYGIGTGLAGKILARVGRCTASDPRPHLRPIPAPRRSKPPPVR
jgi:hypothetical protein